VEMRERREKGRKREEGREGRGGESIRAMLDCFEGGEERV